MHACTSKKRKISGARSMQNQFRARILPISNPHGEHLVPLFIYIVTNRYGFRESLCAKYCSSGCLPAKIRYPLAFFNLSRSFSTAAI